MAFCNVDDQKFCSESLWTIIGRCTGYVIVSNFLSLCYLTVCSGMRCSYCEYSNFVPYLTTAIIHSSSATAEPSHYCSATRCQCADYTGANCWLNCLTGSDCSVTAPSGTDKLGAVDAKCRPWSVTADIFYSYSTTDTTLGE